MRTGLSPNTPTSEACTTPEQRHVGSTGLFLNLPPPPPLFEQDMPTIEGMDSGRHDDPVHRTCGRKIMYGTVLYRRSSAPSLLLSLGAGGLPVCRAVGGVIHLWIRVEYSYDRDNDNDNDNDYDGSSRSRTPALLASTSMDNARWKS